MLGVSLYINDVGSSSVGTLKKRVRDTKIRDGIRLYSRIYMIILKIL
jgi:predicted acyl esterase